MNLLKRLFSREKPKTFEGTVVDVQIVDGFFSCGGKQYNRYSKHLQTDIQGYDESGMPIKDSYYVAQYRAIVLNQKGETKSFERHGRVPEVGFIRYPSFTSMMRQNFSKLGRST